MKCTSYFFSLLLGFNGGPLGTVVQTVVVPVATTAGVLVCGLFIGSPSCKSISVIIYYNIS